MNDDERAFLIHVKEAIAVYLDRNDPNFENWPLWYLHDEIEERLTGVTPVTLL